MKNSTSFNSIDWQSYITVSGETVIEVSQSFIHMAEYELEEFLNKDIAEVFSILRAGPSIDILDINIESDFFIFTKKHEVRFVNIEKIPLCQEVRYVFYEKPGSQLDEKLQFVQALLSDNKSGIGIYHAPDLTLLKANQQYLNFLDKPYNRMEHSIGHNIREIVTGWVGSQSEIIWNTVLSTEKVYYANEFMYDRFERGITYWQATISPVFEKGKLKYIIENATEITNQVLDRKKIEEQTKIIKQQKEQLEAIVQNVSDGLFLFSKDGNITFLNEEAYKFVYNPEQCRTIGDINKNTEYFDRDGKPIAFNDMPGVRAVNGQKVRNYFLTAKRPDETMHYNISASPIYDSKGIIVSGLLSCHDITELVTNQKRLLETEREKNEALEKAMEMKDEFLSLISHEFKTPLNVINTAIQALNYIYGDELPDKVKEYIYTIRQNTFRQLRLVNNLLDITRANAGRIRIHKRNIDIVFLTRSITESVYQYASQKGVTITFLSSFGKKIMGIDDEKYERIILNLLSNAIKFTPEGKNIIVNLQTVKGNICVEVKDNGIGIPPNKIDVIFERFGQVDSSLSRRAEGTGIGLSLVKKFVEALGGSISVKSRVGKGTTFTILLPDEKAAEEHDEKPMVDLQDNRLVQVTNVEFSDIYF